MASSHDGGIFHSESDSSFRKRYTDRLLLSAQLSTCGTYLMGNNWEDWFLRDSDAIVWGAPLGKMLEGETLWGGRELCMGCWVFKPTSAFGEVESAFELPLAQALGVGEVDGNGDSAPVIHEKCRRCRVKEMVLLADVEEVFVEQIVYGEIIEAEWKNSLGVRGWAGKQKGEKIGS